MVGVPPASGTLMTDPSGLDPHAGPCNAHVWLPLFVQ
jgi:hypothetical protein